MTRNRSGTADTVDEVRKMPLSNLNAEIAKCEWGFLNGGTSQGRKSFFKRLVWLEQVREEIHGTPAPKRSFRSQ